MVKWFKFDFLHFLGISSDEEILSQGFLDKHGGERRSRQTYLIEQKQAGYLLLRGHFFDCEILHCV
jgi:hypothetical protein